ncbi:lipopolysaccharide biosynthesis protein [Pedobacter deserti]|uniref:lipopolysaccharide biosynthesis protein n=1 Tax=Pedobacter deserti TaxID=2817382 RepID=UPI0021091257|nr:oligosaccharide flippase family protein [Pedobacter sp. SYSU D00382]
MNFISEIYKKIQGSPFLKSGIAVGAGKGIVIVSNFLIFFMLVRICSPGDYGIWVLFTTITAIFEVANTSFINNALIKYYNEYTGGRRGVFIYNAFLFCFALTTGIALLQLLSIIFIDYIYHSETLVNLMFYAPALLLFSGLINFINCIEQGNLRFYGQLLSSIIRSGIFIIYLLYLFFGKSEYSLAGFALVNIASGFLAFCVVTLSTRQFISVSRRLRPEIVSKIARYGFFTFGVEVIGQISNNIGQLISGALLSTSAVGIINIAMRVLQFIEVPLQSISTVLMPKGVKTLKDEGMEGIKKLYEKSSAIITAVMLPFLLLLFIFSDQVIYFLSGGGFEEASVLLRIIVVYSLFKPFGRNAGVILNAIGKTRINFFMVLIPTALNLILNYLLIQAIGVTGSPVATLIATLVGFGFNQYILYKIAGVKMAIIISEIGNYYQFIFNLASKRSK